MAITAAAALWFLPFVLPICFYVAFTDLREMRITNQAVIALALVFVFVGPFLMSWPDYGLRLVQGGVVLVLGMIANARGAIGAGDAKFIAAAAPFIAPGDLRTILVILAANLLAAFATHRIAKHTALRRLVPHWKSWDVGRSFPMGLSLGGTLAIYLVLGALLGG